MNRSLRVAIADDELDMREFFEEVLRRMGHTVVASAANGQQLVDACLSLRPDIVITDIKMPDMDGLEAATCIYRKFPVPIIVVSGYHDPEFVERAKQTHVLAYLVKPIREINLAPAIQIVLQRFEEFLTLQRETEDLRQALEDRKMIERAKGILMQQAKLTEEAAFRRLQKVASSNNQKLIEAARMIVATAAALLPGDDP
jgi:two-component system, response regulator PdtaR